MNAIYVFIDASIQLWYNIIKKTFKFWKQERSREPWIAQAQSQGSIYDKLHQVYFFRFSGVCAKDVQSIIYALHALFFRMTMSGQYYQQMLKERSLAGESLLHICPIFVRFGAILVFHLCFWHNASKVVIIPGHTSTGLWPSLQTRTCWTWTRASEIRASSLQVCPGVQSVYRLCQSNYIFSTQWLTWILHVCESCFVSINVF